MRFDYQYVVPFVLLLDKAFFYYLALEPITYDSIT